MNEKFNTHSEKLIFIGANMYFWMKVNNINNLSIEFNCKIIRIFGKNRLIYIM